VSCSGVRWPNIDDVAAERDDPERDERHMVAAMIGAKVKTTLSAAAGA
jgi:hypothetical protein